MINKRKKLKKYIIEKELEGIRIDKAISEKDKDISRAMVQKMLTDGKIFVNGKVPKSSYKLAIGDEVEIEEIIPKGVDIKPEDIPLDVVYEDDDILVINKQKGLVVHPRKW